MINKWKPLPKLSTLSSSRSNSTSCLEADFCTPGKNGQKRTLTGSPLTICLFKLGASTTPSGWLLRPLLMRPPRLLASPQSRLASRATLRSLRLGTRAPPLRAPLGKLARHRSGSLGRLLHTRGGILARERLKLDTHLDQLLVHISATLHPLFHACPLNAQAPDAPAPLRLSISRPSQRIKH